MLDNDSELDRDNQETGGASRLSRCAEAPVTSMLADDAAWVRAGLELRERDPQRFMAILKVVEDIVAIRRDPIGAVRAAGHFVFARSKQRDPD